MRTLLLLFASITLQAQSSDGWLDLLPDEALAGWTRVPIPSILGVNPAQQWRVDPKEKTLTCTGTGGHEWLRLDKEFGDYILEVDWRFTPKPGDNVRYNSGIGVLMSKYGDIWHQAQTGPLGFLFGETLQPDGAIRRVDLRKEVKENRIKPAGEWNHYEIRVQQGTVSLTINGALANEIKGIGLRRGYLGLEAEGYEITFKNIRLKPLS